MQWVEQREFSAEALDKLWKMDEQDMLLRNDGEEETWCWKEHKKLKVFWKGAESGKGILGQRSKNGQKNNDGTVVEAFMEVLPDPLEVHQTLPMSTGIKGSHKSWARTRNAVSAWTGYSSAIWLNTICSPSQWGTPLFLNFLATFFFINLALVILCWPGGQGLAFILYLVEVSCFSQKNFCHFWNFFISASLFFCFHRCSFSSALLTFSNVSFRAARSSSILHFSSSFSTFFSATILMLSSIFVHSGVLNANVSSIRLESKPYVVSRSWLSWCRFLSSFVFGLMFYDSLCIHLFSQSAQEMSSSKGYIFQNSELVRGGVDGHVVSASP